MKRILLLAVAVVSLLSSCSPDLHLDITKRRYRKGFHVNAGLVQKSSSVEAKVNTPAHKLPVHVKGLPVRTAEPVLSERAAPSVPASASPAVASSQNVVRVARNTDRAVAASELVVDRTQSSRLTSKVQTVKQAVKHFFHPQEDVPFWLLIVLCILLPPLAVFLKYGIGTEFWISLILTLIFWLPGVIYALIVVTR
jgi:uncharacterized membrane protein YqaE (UPF0057 family)